DEPREVAGVPVAGFFLEDHGEPPVVEDVEEFLPGDLLQIVAPGAVAGNVESEDARAFLVVGVTDNGGNGVPLLRPTADFVMVGGLIVGHGPSYLEAFPPYPPAGPSNETDRKSVAQGRSGRVI